ncbi:hypothetical protein Pelo_16817 [Pelomyxa schiedti]|nr:hypothetical protein Pelo_16817 [Pelomyxa schiedti]
MQQVETEIPGGDGEWQEQGPSSRRKDAVPHTCWCDALVEIVERDVLEIVSLKRINVKTEKAEKRNKGILLISSLQRMETQISWSYEEVPDGIKEKELNSCSRNVNTGGRKMNTGSRKMNVGGENIQKLVFRVSRDNPLGGNRIRAAFCSKREESTNLEDTTNLMAHEVSQMAKEKTRPPILNDDNENA